MYRLRLIHRSDPRWRVFFVTNKNAKRRRGSTGWDRNKSRWQSSFLLLIVCQQWPWPRSVFLADVVAVARDSIFRKFSILFHELQIIVVK